MMKRLIPLIVIYCIIAVRGEEPCRELFRTKLFEESLPTDKLPQNFPILDLSSDSNADYIAVNDFIHDVFSGLQRPITKETCLIQFPTMMKCFHAFMNDGVRDVLKEYQISRSSYALGNENLNRMMFKRKAERNCGTLTTGSPWNSDKTYVELFDENISDGGSFDDRMEKIWDSINAECGSPSMTGQNQQSSNTAPEDNLMNGHSWGNHAPGMAFGYKRR